MILADVRHRLTRNDAQLAMRLIARGDERELEQCEAALRDHGIDALLDDPRLIAALMSAPQGAHACHDARAPRARYVPCEVMIRHCEKGRIPSGGQRVRPHVRRPVR